MIERHLPNVLTYFKHRITNAGSEAINSVIQMLKKRAFGYRSFPNFRAAVLFHCGGLPRSEWCTPPRGGLRVAMAARSASRARKRSFVAPVAHPPTLRDAR